MSEPNAYHLPYISSILDKLGNSRYLCTLDIRNAYWQIPLDDQSKKCTAFTIPGPGLFHFNHMSFDLHGAPGTFQYLVHKLFGPELEPLLFKYLDDIIIVTSNFEKHIEILTEVFKQLLATSLTLSREKCEFCNAELKFLGYVINTSGLNVDPDSLCNCFLTCS